MVGQMRRSVQQRRLLYPLLRRLAPPHALLIRAACVLDAPWVGLGVGWVEGIVALLVHGVGVAALDLLGFGTGVRDEGDEGGNKVEGDLELV